MHLISICRLQIWRPFCVCVCVCISQWGCNRRWIYDNCDLVMAFRKNTDLKYSCNLKSFHKICGFRFVLSCRVWSIPFRIHDDVIKWKHFPHHWLFVRGMNSPHKCQWRGALMFPLICTWINGWVNNRDAGDLRHHSAHYDVIVKADRGELPALVWTKLHARVYIGDSASLTSFHWYDTGYDWKYHPCSNYGHCLLTRTVENGHTQIFAGTATHDYRKLILSHLHPPIQIIWGRNNWPRHICCYVLTDFTLQLVTV